VTSIYGKSPTEVVNQGGVAGFCFHHQPVSFPPSPSLVSALALFVPSCHPTLTTSSSAASSWTLL
jgi:hypothetical protein